MDHIEPSFRVLDVACGTGALALTMAGKASHVTGIDLSEENIAAANRSARRSGKTNIRFEIRDAGDLSCYVDKQFDLAVTSMAIHQFDPDIAVLVLSEMKRIARRLVITDYSQPMPRSWGRSVAWGIERLAGGDHYRNFRLYMQLGGIHHFTRKAGIIMTSEVIRGGGVFIVAYCKGDI
jgi:ubiquinone/menaquinone biosynthesis C-methylase UbiE